MDANARTYAQAWTRMAARIRASRMWTDGLPRAHALERRSVPGEPTAARTPAADVRMDALMDLERRRLTRFGPAVVARYMNAYEAKLAPGAALAPFLGARGKSVAERPAD
jgi:hypothetical protein